MKNDEREEALQDLMLAQADVFYRPKDESIDMAIKALKNHISLENIKADIQKYISENKNSDDLYLSGCGDGAYHSLAIIDKHIKEI